MASADQTLAHGFDEIYAAGRTASDQQLLMSRPHLFRAYGVHDQLDAESERIAIAWHFLEREGLQGKTVLDYGCGSAKAAVVMSQEGARVVGFDISAESIRVGRRRVVANGAGDAVDLLVASGDRLPFPTASFDHVFGYEVLFYLNGKHEFGDEILRVLKPNGMALFCEALGGSPVLKVVRRVMRHATGSATRIGTPMTRDDIQRAFCNARSVDLVPVNILAMAKRFLGVEPSAALSLLRRMDSGLMKFPPARQLCGEAVIVIRK